MGKINITEVRLVRWHHLDTFVIFFFIVLNKISKLVTHRPVSFYGLNKLFALWEIRFLGLAWKINKFQVAMLPSHPSKYFEHGKFISYRGHIWNYGYIVLILWPSQENCAKIESLKKAVENKGFKSSFTKCTKLECTLSRHINFYFF